MKRLRRLLISIRANDFIKTFRRALTLLSKSEKNKISLIILLQVFFGFLDLIGVGLMGVLGSLAASGIQSVKPGNRVSTLLEVLHLSNYPMQKQVAIIGLIASIILITKTILSVFFNRKTIYFLSRRGALISSRLVLKLLSQPILKLQENSMQQTLFSVTNGVGIITVGVLGIMIALISDVALLLVMSTGLFLVDSTMTILIMFMFIMIGVFLYKLMHNRMRNLGSKSAEVGISSSEKIFEILTAYREAVVKNRRNYYAREIGKQRMKLANISAEMSFMPNVSKYVMEVTVVIAALFISAFQFLTNDSARAISLLALFLTASLRIAPAVLRVQQSLVSVKGSIGIASITLDLIDSLGKIEPLDVVSDKVNVSHTGFVPTISINDVFFKYQGSSRDTLNRIRLNIEVGSFVAIVGPSGAGKTTLVDVILGVISPQSGHVIISGKSPSEASKNWSGAISYVPQDIVISNGTIKENICMGYPAEDVDDKLIWDAIEVAELKDFVLSLPNGINSQVGDRGTKISGGQRQRLGIARAVFTKPLLLVLDEATSSLDGETEANINGSVLKMRGEVTVVMIAHRLSTVRHADLVVYMETGKVVASGNFDEVRKLVPNFDKQAQLMGL